MISQIEVIPFPRSYKGNLDIPLCEILSQEIAECFNGKFRTADGRKTEQPQVH